jgi:hypothetical protein
MHRLSLNPALAAAMLLCPRSTADREVMELPAAEHFVAGGVMPWPQ